MIAAGEQIDLYFAPVGLVINGLIDYNLQFDMTDLIKKHNVDLGLLEKTSVDAMKEISGGIRNKPVLISVQYQLSLSTDRMQPNIMKITVRPAYRGLIFHATDCIYINGKVDGIRYHRQHIPFPSMIGMAGEALLQ